MIEFLSPESARTHVSLAPPAPMTEIDGASIGLLEVPFANSTLFLDQAVKALEREHGPIRIAKRYAKPSVSVPTPPEVLDEFATECDFVVSAYGH